VLSTLWCISIPLAFGSDGDLTAAIRKHLGPNALADRFEVVEENDDAAVVSFEMPLRERISDEGYVIPAGRTSFYAHLGRGSGGAWTVLNVVSQRGFLLSAVEADALRSRLLLAASTDEFLIADFARKRDVYDEIGTVLLSLPAKDSHFSLSHEYLGPLLREANVERLDRSVLPDSPRKDRGCNALDCFTITIASTIASRVGYLHVDDDARVPRMTPGDYMLIRSLGDGWYLFRQSI
jgi:hypothetical protein